MTPEPLIREAHSDDVEALVALLGALLEQEAEFEPHAGRQRRALHALLRDPDRAVVVVAADAGDVVGGLVLLRSLSTTTGGHVCWMEDVVVRHDRRGTGIGNALVQAAITEAGRRGWTRISVVTDPDNAAALQLYTTAGFKRSSMVLLRRSEPAP